jgi:uncharacterized membrane protein YraQ (UPF0718 family)
MKKETKKKNKKSKWIFLGVVGIVYLLVFFLNKEQFYKISLVFVKIIKQMIPIFSIVIFLMFILNYFVSNEFLKKHMGEGSGIKAWVIAIVAGVLSIGPIYMWYPLMKELKKSGVKDRYIAAFLYNRGIKLQWLPMLVLYFSWKFSIVLLLVMLIVSIPQGIITEQLTQHKK